MRDQPGCRWLAKPPLGYDLDAGHPLASGLQGAWLLNDGGIAKSAWDISPYRNTLSTPSFLAISQDAPGYCLKPSSASGYMSGTTTQGNVGYPFTAYVLFMPTAFSNNGFYWNHWNTSTIGFHCGVNTSGNPITNTNGTTQTFTNLTMSLNQWYHVAHVCTGASKAMKAYLATWPGGPIGNQQLTQSNATPSGMSNIAIAGRKDSGSNSPAGKLALCYWWNYALASGQITDLFADPLGFVLPPNVQRWGTQGNLAVADTFPAYNPRVWWEEEQIEEFVVN